LDRFLPGPENVLTSAWWRSMILVFAAFVHRRLAATEAAIEARRRVTARNIAEVFVEGISGLAEGVIGHGSERYVSLLASFFVFILVANLLGLVPGFTPPTPTSTSLWRSA
jgi:F-type H+-transporting ATPase subunit a